MDALEVAQYFLVDGREFLVQADRSVLFCLLTLFGIRAAAAVLTLEDLVLPSVEITFDRRSVSKLEFPVVRTEQAAIRVGLEVYRTEWIVAVVLVFRFFLIYPAQPCIPRVHEAEQDRLQHIDPTVSWPSQLSIPFRFQIPFDSDLLHDLVKCQYRIADFQTFC